MRIGIFGGSFNPVHLGHVALAVRATEALHLDKLYVIPSYANPFKTKSDKILGKERLKMCRLAFKEVPKTQVLPIELKRKGPSYTIDTIEELERKKLITSKDTLFLLMGQDVAEDLTHWKSIDLLLDHVTMVIVERTGFSETHKSQKILFLDMPLFDVSSTEIRKRLHKNGYVGHLLPKNVNTYIQKHDLYT